MATWQLQEAKAKFSAVLNAAQQDGPQIITRHGVVEAIVVNVEEWNRLQKGRKLTPLEVLRSGPLGDLPLPDRKKSRYREVKPL